MNIVSTHFKILRCLHHEVYTISDLSFILGIPDFKVRKYIRDLEYLLKSNGNLEIYNTIRKYPNKAKKLKELQNFSPDERQSYIILSFLFSNMIQLTKLSKELNVSRRTISKDLIELKDSLNQFNLELESLSFQGIKLNGLEINKRKIFKLFLFKNINNVKYLPLKLKNLILAVQNLSKNNEIINLINELMKIHSSLSGLELNHIEFLICIASIRRKYIDLCSSKENLLIKDKSHKKLKILLSNSSYLTNYEKLILINYCENKKYASIVSNEKNTVFQLQNLIKIINNEFLINIKLDYNLFMKIYAIFKHYEFKQITGFTNFYLFNKNLSKEYLDILKKLKKILQTHFYNIDSYELIFMSSILLIEILKDMNSKIKKLENVIIVYKSLSTLILKELCCELEIHKVVSIENFVYITHLEEYIKNNEVIYIITFEDLYITNKTVPILKLLLPITQSDKLKIKNIFNI